MPKKAGYTVGSATLVFKGLTLEQAKCFAEWYEGQGEQDESWFEEQNIPAPMSDVSGGKYMKVDLATQTVTCQLHTPPQ
jgi:hypothetical protein